MYFFTQHRQLISEPVALDDIEAKITGGAYASLDDMQSDVMLMIRNAQAYNAEGSQVHMDASKLGAVFAQARSRAESRPTSATGPRATALGASRSPGDSPTPGTPQALSAGPFACPVCGQMFTRQSNATRHTRLVHGPGATEYDGAAASKVQQPLR